MDKRSRTVATSLAAVCIAVGAIIWWGTTNHYAVTHEPPANTPEPDLADANPTVTEAHPVETVGLEGHTTLVDEPWYRLAPEEVINSPDCRLVPGVAEAQESAIVMVAGAEEQIWFAVVDHRGVLFGDYLPFVPRSFNGVHAALGKRSDGSTLAAVRSFRQGEVIVVHDGQPVYQATDTWDFDLAPDGSTFFAIEPLAGGSRLVVRNLDTAHEHHHDLGDSLPPAGWRGGVLYGWYAASHAEVIVNANGMEGGTYRFYPVDGGPAREVRFDVNEGIDNIDIFRSSELSYHGRVAKNNSLEVFKAERQFDADGRVSRTAEVWSRNYPAQEFGGVLTPPLVSDDGAWVVFGLETGGMVLNADTGKTVINVPFDPASFRQYGDPTGVHFLDGRLTLYRYKDAGSERTAEVYYPVSNTTQAWPAERTVVESVPRARIAGFQKPEDTDSRQEMAHPLKAPCAHPALSDNRALVGDGDRLTYRIPPDSAKAP